MASFSPFDMYFRELEIIGSYAVPAESFVRSAALISHSEVSLDMLITDVYRLEDLEKDIMKAEREEGLKKLAGRRNRRLINFANAIFRSTVQKDRQNSNKLKVTSCNKEPHYEEGFKV